MREQKELYLLDGSLLFSAEVKNKLIAILSSMKDDITIAALRDAVGINRKQALLMLDFLDLQGITKRSGDKRLLV